jgi:Undecaprenyl-phosphate glucose phosphotransferase
VQPVGARIPHRILVDFVALIDVMLVVLAAYAAKLLYISLFLDDPQAHQLYLVAGLAGGFVVQYVMHLRQLHEPSAIVAWRERIGALLVSIGLSFLTLIAMAYLLKISTSYSRGWLLTWLCLSALLLTASRPLLAHLLSWLTTTGYTARRIAVVGDGDACERLVQTLRNVSGVWVAGVFSDTSGERTPLSGTIEDLISIGQRDEIDEVAIALSDTRGHENERLVDSLSILPVDVWLCPTELTMPILATARIGPLSLLQVKLKPIRDWGYLVKLVFDYVAGAICLVAFAPLMLAIAAAIKLDSTGPVFFRQRRHGFNHRIIDVFKFRTMTVAENGDRVDQACKNDPRVTRVGRFLRKTSLDELPQLFNVLRGEMSLVGPRPHALAHNQHYRERLDRYASRHCVKPGMTGWAQINGLRGPTEDPEKMRLRVHMDLYYIENWSLWLDLKIIAATPFVGFIHRNAL